MADTEPKPKYDCVPLKKDDITICIVQSRLNRIDAANAAKCIKDNLNHVLELIDAAQAWGAKRDLVVFHEFPLQGFSFASTRQEQLRIAIDVPGPETQAIGEKAKKYNCYIHFGCYGKLPDWPNHFMNMGVIVGPTGDVVHKKWKLRNLSGWGFSTTVYDVLDAYVERYGWEAVFPVARLDIGNIAIMPCVLEPEIARMFAIKGTEVLIRYMTAGAGYWSPDTFSLHGGGGIHTFRVDMQAMCMTNSFYGVFVNNSATPGMGITDQGSGHSAIIDPDGRILVEALSSTDTTVEAAIPIAAFRKKHQLPKVPKELYTDFHKNYISKYPPNAFTGALPNTIADSVQLYGKLARW